MNETVAPFSHDDAQDVWLYRLFDVRRRLLYVGITTDVDKRISQHREKAWGHRIASHLATRLDPAVAREIERDTIRSERPKYNTVHNGPTARLDPKREEELRRRKAARIGADQYGTLAEVAAFLGVNPRTVRRRVADGSLVAYRLPGNRLIRVKWSDVDRAMRPIPAATSVRP